MTDVVVPEVLPTSVEEWAVRIRGHLADGVQAVLAVGDDLTQATAALGRGEMATLAATVGLSTGSVRKFRAIAANPAIRSHGNALPPAWTTLYELSTLPAGDLSRAIESGEVVREMDRKDAAALVKRVKQVEAKQPDPEPPAGATDAEARDAVYNLQHKVQGHQSLKQRAGKLLAAGDWVGAHKMATLALFLNVNKRSDLLRRLDTGASYDEVKAEVDAWRAGTDLAGPVGGVPATATGSATDSDGEVPGPDQAAVSPTEDLETTDVATAGDDLDGVDDAEVPLVSDDASHDVPLTDDVMAATPAPSVEMSEPPESAPTDGSADASEGAADNTNHGPAVPDEVERVSVHDRPRHSMGTSTLADLPKRAPAGSGRKVSREMLTAARSKMADVEFVLEGLDPRSLEGVQAFGDDAVELHDQALKLKQWASELEFITRPAEGGRS